MASVKGLLILFKLGDGASPEQFNRFCSLTAHTLNFEGQEVTDEEIDCDDPEAIAWLVAELQSKRVTISGSGKLNLNPASPGEDTDFDVFFEWWDSGEPRNGQAIIDVTAAVGGRMLEGEWLLSAFSLTGERGQKATTDVTIGSTGPITKSNNP